MNETYQIPLKSTPQSNYVTFNINDRWLQVETGPNVNGPNLYVKFMDATEYNVTEDPNWMPSASLTVSKFAFFNPAEELVKLPAGI